MGPVVLFPIEKNSSDLIFAINFLKKYDWLISIIYLRGATQYKKYNEKLFMG